MLKLHGELENKHKFKGLRFHDLRHTHATILLAQGVHPKIVQERLGHESITITMDTYSHILPGLQEEAMKKFDEAFSVKNSKQNNPV
ncbi:MAG: tyrosine-type recombinase/integrase [Clostridiales bacterium]|nr:tyrosine-type recombinase/integrase [Clostridiales bacterium]MCF8022021.1 tyrosine-type recombinase/integrase [Clostridiales bacterium]